DHVEHGGLAGPVRTEQPHRFAPPQLETDAADDGTFLETLHHLGDDEPAGESRIDVPGWRALRGMRGGSVSLCGDCPAAWERQQFAHYPFRSELKRRPVNIPRSSEWLRAHLRDERILGVPAIILL